MTLMHIVRHFFSLIVNALAVNVKRVR